MLDREEITDIFEEFLNEFGMFTNFQSWIEDKGFSLSEFGMTEED